MLIKPWKSNRSRSPQGDLAPSTRARYFESDYQIIQGTTSKHYRKHGDMLLSERGDKMYTIPASKQPGRRDEHREEQITRAVREEHREEQRTRAAREEHQGAGGHQSSKASAAKEEPGIGGEGEWQRRERVSWTARARKGGQMAAQGRRPVNGRGPAYPVI